VSAGPTEVTDVANKVALETVEVLGVGVNKMAFGEAAFAIHHLYEVGEDGI
jgi:hypothetical protein